jgi:acetylornithine deacetylase
MMMTAINKLNEDAIQLLRDLISTPSFSKEEDKTAALIFSFLESNGVAPLRYLNNVWAVNKHFDKSKPSILLNSHHDTVKPNPQYTKNPFAATIEDGKLYGLGSNDAGGCLVSLMATFIYFYEAENLNFNLVIAASAEEEISGKDGIEALLKNILFLQSLKGSEITGAIVGEPTLLQMAIAERGLMVLDATAEGKAGHAARNEGENAIYKAMQDIEWFRSFKFDNVSDLLGEVKMNVTVIETENKAHNVVPAFCKFVVDVRVNELYTPEEVLTIIRKNTKSNIVERSMRLRSSSIAFTHPIVQSGLALNLSYYGSPTTSDKALMDFSALKMGPGDSARSHSADEFIFVNEIKDGITLYIQLLEKVLQ